MVAIDLDTGNVQGKALVAAVQKFTGQVQMRVYSSSSATKAARKWRVLIPLADAMRYDEWLALTVAINQHIERELGVRPDRALERAGQPIYLPNTAPRTDGIEPLVADTLVEGAPLAWRESPGNESVLQVMAEEERRTAGRRPGLRRIGGGSQGHLRHGVRVAGDVVFDLRDQVRDHFKVIGLGAVRLFDAP